jgi:hypothetical protein
MGDDERMGEWANDVESDEGKTTREMRMKIR